MDSVLSLPKQRDKKAGDKLRIAPTRRTSVSPDSWGIHSVPGMLNEFQRHTSQHTPVDKRHGMLTDLLVEEDWKKRDRLILSGIMLLALSVSVCALQIVKHTTLDGLEPDSNQPLSHMLHALCALSGQFMLVSIATAPKIDSVVGVSALMQQVRLFYPAALVAVSFMLSSAWCPYVCALSVLNIPKHAGKYTLLWLGLACVVPALVQQSWIVFLGLLALVMPRIDWAAIETRYPLAMRVRVPRFMLKTRLVCLISGVTLILISVALGSPIWHLAALEFVCAASFAIYLASRDVNSKAKFNFIAAFLISGSLCFWFEKSIHSQQPSSSYVFDFFKPLLLSIAMLAPALWLEPNEFNIQIYNSKLSAESVIDSILMHEDTRNIFYFFMLNFSFMFVQLLFSLLSHSLVLLSDTIHMFFDCLSLLVGLVASILSKMPASVRFPYGVAMVETLPGFANGCLLLAIPVGILFESFERVANPVPPERTTQLLGIG